MFGKKKGFKKIEFNPEEESPLIKCNTCNRDMVAGFKNKKTGEFREVMTVNSDEEIEKFAAACGVTQVTKKY